MAEAKAFAIRNATLKVVSEDGTIVLGEVENVQITIDDHYDDVYSNYSMDALTSFKTKSTYSVTADFVPDEDGIFLKVITPKTLVAMTAVVEIKENTLPAISAAHASSGAPEDATVDVTKSDLSDIYLATFSWEENK